MAQGTGTDFDALFSYVFTNTVDITSGTWKLALLTTGVNSITAAESNPRLGGGVLTEVSAGGGYSAGGISLTKADTDSSGVYTEKLDTGVHTSGQITITSTSTNPTNAKTALLYDSASSSNQAVTYWDLTPDAGGTALDLTAADLTLDFSTGPGEIAEWS